MLNEPWYYSNDLSHSGELALVYKWKGTARNQLKTLHLHFCKYYSYAPVKMKHSTIIIALVCDASWDVECTTYLLLLGKLVGAPGQSP